MLAKKQAYEEFGFFSYCVILLYFSKKGYSLHFFLCSCGFWALSFLTFFFIPFFLQFYAIPVPKIYICPLKILAHHGVLLQNLILLDAL